MAHPRSALLNVMVAAAQKAARKLVRDFGEVEHLQVSKKGPADFVSTADTTAEKTLCAELRKARPRYAFLTEEEGAIPGTDTSNRWIIDPLDGTTNFLHGLPHFAISIALERDGEAIAGGCPPGGGPRIRCLPRASLIGAATTTPCSCARWRR